MKGLLARLCVEVDVTKPLIKLQRLYVFWIIKTLPTFVSIVKSHKFDSRMFNSKSIALKLRKLQEVSQVDESLGLRKEGKVDTLDADWVKVHLKRVPRPVSNLVKVSRKVN